MINPIVYQFIKQAKLSEKDKKKILDAAIKYYDNNDPDDPKHRWDHMLDVMDVAKKIRGRDLDKDEFGMIAFHDSGYKHPKGYAYAKSRHPMFGAKIFRKEGPKLGYSPEEIKRIAKVIAYHNHRPDYTSSPLLKDDMQMLLFSADEGTPIDLKDDAKMYYVKGRSGVYKGVDPKSKDFIKQLVAKVKTFGNYSKLKRLKYYNDAYPGYLQSKYDFWQSPDLEKYYKELDKKDKKKEDKYSIHGAILGCLGDNAKKFKYNITEDLPGDPWGAIINTDPVDVDEVRKFHSYHNIDVDKAGVPYYFLTKNERTGDKYVWYSDDEEPIRINNKKEKEYAKKVGIKKGLVPEQLDFKFTEKKAEFDYPDLQVNPKNKITRLLKNLKWGVRVNGRLSSDDGLLFKLDPNKKYEVVGDDNSDIASCVDLTNRVIKANNNIGSLATMRSDGTVPHVTPLFKYKGKYYLRSGKHKFSDPYDSLDEIGDRWFKHKSSVPVPEYLDFYELPAGETLDEKDLSKLLDEIKRKAKKTYRKSYTDRKHYKKKEASKLYTYVDPDADLSKGILSARLAPEDVLLRRYPGRAKSKKELLELMQERLDDKDRPDLVYALSEPIPNRATEKLRRFRDARKLISYDTDDIKDLIKILKRNYRKPPSEVKDVERKKYIQWGRKPKDGGAFFYAPVYKILTESGRIPPEILKEE